MGADRNFEVEGTGKHRRMTTALYGIIVTAAFELGEIARMEIEIQKSYPHASPQPRCPCWHGLPSVNWPASPPH